MSPDRSRRTRPERGKSLIADRPLRSPARIIYVVPEGEVTEPGYCTALNNYFKDEHQFYINTRYSRKNGLHPLEVAEAAATIASDPRERGDNGPVHEVWALFDRDQHTDVREAFARIREHIHEKLRKYRNSSDSPAERQAARPLRQPGPNNFWHQAASSPQFATPAPLSSNVQPEAAHQQVVTLNSAIRYAGTHRPISGI